MDIYKEKILEHYKKPHNYGHLKNPDKSNKAINVSCGDEIEVDLIIKDQKVTEVGFESKGCIISTAMMSMLTDYIKDKKVNQIMKINTKDLQKIIGIDVSPARLKCLLIPLQSIQQAISKN
ncbi:hypothetical protein A2X44_00830 [candidate division CPR3 bacterium GWF2_35_18]|uniref:SUF system FeS assembly protein, NifU family n=1 Tax=candidate division CPR3 bacterium GW2011_GWF2_35_18 TaxID=1618350 RepID=A0A0G0BLD6_UNCC3|nr:MAG: SUF system FeS assembly protein, NifU family [candidate division CPR3 bacterium GW2011_GWF2_35_18]KKP85528.1 MAG: SUF system FeS assembly protein, NifU family [candidate division CPR3 bacterium GW2011_GWE2_35_7]OGB63450.1 MAG: hypothetical protein A2X44_00830 [candidate division CPR3 bacterium GWF2_35_18]OGB64804.1 MAG: hypothetical protein A2250_05195 [candidate division CPR3 bacterium RIFOXYA2_FULL_35_13]OGB77190.1 MAG: hypothetical protein A2476_03725 [candidate division CPR3 bacteri